MPAASGNGSYHTASKPEFKPFSNPISSGLIRTQTMVEMAFDGQCGPFFLSVSRLAHCDHVIAEAGLPQSGRGWKGSSEMLVDCMDALPKRTLSLEVQYAISAIPLDNSPPWTKH